MPSYVTEAVVTGSRRFSEADRIVTLLTLARGRVGAVAKSARKPKSSFQGATEPFVHGIFELAEGRSLDIIRHAQVIDAHLGIRQSWAKIQLAGHVAEIASRMGEEKHPDEELFFLTLSALKDIDGGDPSAVVKFKSGLLAHIGIFPDLSSCSGCGSTRVRGQVHLDSEGGGFLCGSCAKKRGVYSPVPMDVLHLLNSIRVDKNVPDTFGFDVLDAADDLLTVLLQSFIQAGFRTVAAERHARVKMREIGEEAAPAGDSNSDDQMNQPGESNVCGD